MSQAELDLDHFTPGEIHRIWLQITQNALAKPVSVPVFIAKGAQPGPTFGITAALHGNEINGIPVIHRLIEKINVHKLRGNIVAVPVMNISGFQEEERTFNQTIDLNHIMPGKKNGNTAQVYAYRLFNKIVKKFDYLVDLHTASFGRQNTLYIRADLDDPVAKKMAELINPEIILHNPPNDKTLRGAATKNKIPSITVEIGNPHRFQEKYIKWSVTGIRKILHHLKMTAAAPQSVKHHTYFCKKSQWIYTQTGGVLRVLPELGEIVEKDQLIAQMTDIFGTPLESYYSPSRGIIIGKSVNPIAETGARVIHLGSLK